MKIAMWKIALAVYLTLVALGMLTNIQVVWMGVLVLTGIAAIVAAIMLLFTE